MTKHTLNIKGFVDASKSIKDPIIKAYCGLVAVELVLKDAVGLKNHDVPAAIKKFALKFAIDEMYGCRSRLNSLSTQLSRELSAITTQGTDKVACSCPTSSYPYLRYVRHQVDGWPLPCTTTIQAQELASTVEQIQFYLRKKFNKSL